MDETDLFENLIPLRIALLGQSMVGKSALTYRFIKNKFPDEFDATIEDSYSFPVEINGFQCHLEILDTAGQDDYQTMIDTWINNADGFMLVYSIDNKESFESVKLRYERIIRIKDDEKYAILIVGNKCDLEEKRKVSKEEVETYCESINAKFLETSALKSINVRESFLYLSHCLLEFFSNEKAIIKPVEKRKKCCYCCNF
jgi:small GTP-binding protein